MSEVVISAEGVGKKFLIGHRTIERYVTLRDVIAMTIKTSARSVREMLRGRPIIAGDEVEEYWALKDVNFAVRKGDVVGVIGRNGAGKSTLLKVLSRITEPSEGRIVIDGRVASLLEVGTGFHPELTGRENIFLNGAILGMSRAETKRKFEEIVSFSGVEQFLDTPVKRYSSGMYVRLAFAVAAHLDSEILLVDEVLAVGDLEFQKKCLGKMASIASSGRTVLFVSHNMGSIASLCNSAMHLEGGSLISFGDVKAVIDGYVSVSGPSSVAKFTTSKNMPSISEVRLDQQALLNGDLIVEVDFQSPFPLQPPVIGLVVFNETGIPVWGTNGRFHPWNTTDFSASSGTVLCDASGIPLAPGSYTLSVWLSDWHDDYEERGNALSFDFRTDAGHVRRPSSQAIGNLDWRTHWTFLGELQAKVQAESD